MLVHSFQKYYLFLYNNMLKRANVNVCPKICKLIPEIWGRGSRAVLPILECAAFPMNGTVLRSFLLFLTIQFHDKPLR